MLRAAIALIPLALTPVWLHLIASGALDLGGGEKDVIWLFPWLLWSVLFAISSFVLWQRGWPIGRSTGRSVAVGFVGVLLAGALLAAIGQLGVGGRF